MVPLSGTWCQAEGGHCDQSSNAGVSILENPSADALAIAPQVECPAVTPQVVLQASGHVERFTDLMVTDAITGEPYRADHLLEHHLEALLEDKKKSLSAADTEVR